MPSVDLKTVGSTLANMEFTVGNTQASDVLYPSGIADLNTNRIIKGWEVFFFCSSANSEMTMLSGLQTVVPTYVRWGPTQALGQPGFFIREVLRGFDPLALFPISVTIPFTPDLNTWYHLVVRRSQTSSTTTFSIGKRGVDITGAPDVKHLFPYGVGLNNGVRAQVNTVTSQPSQLSLFRVDGYYLPRPTISIGGDMTSAGVFGGNYWRGGICELRGWHKVRSSAEVESNATHFVHDVGAANPGVGSVAQQSQELIHCWRLNESTTSGLAFEDVGNFAVQTLGTTNSQVWNRQNQTPLQFTAFPSHPFVVPQPVGNDIPVSGAPAARPGVSLAGSFASHRRFPQASSRPAVTAIIQLDDLRFIETEANPAVIALAAKDFAPPTLATPSAEPNVNVAAQLLTAYIRQGVSVLNPSAGAVFSWDQGVAPETTSAAPSVTAVVLAEKIVTPDTPAADPAVTAAQVAERILAGTASLAPHVMAQVQLADAVSLETGADPSIDALVNLASVVALTTSANPAVVAMAQLLTIVNASGEASTAPAVSLTGSTTELPRSLTPAADPAVTAVVVAEFIRAGTASLDPAVAAVRTQDLAVAASVAPDVAAEYLFNTFAVRAGTASAAPAVAAAVAQCYALSVTASAAPAGAAASATIGVVDPGPVGAEADPAVSVVLGFDIGIELLIKEGTAVLGSPITPEALVAVVDIWNAALVRLGASCVVSTSDTSNEAVKISCVWDEFRTQFLSEHSWNGAKKTVAITRYFNNDGVTVVTPPNRWRFTYELPTDIVKALTLGGLSNEPRADVIWEIESRANDVTTKRVLHTNVEPNSEATELEYIFDVGTNVALLGPKTRWAMSRMLAWTIAENFGKSAEDIVQIEAEAKKALSAAKGIDGQEMTALFFAESGLAAVRDRDRFGFGTGSRGFR